MPKAPARDGRAPLPRPLLDALQDAGVAPAALAQALGLDPAALEAGLDGAQADAFLVAAWQRVADPAFGLKAGRRLRPERFGLSGLAALASPTYGEALARKARYNRLVWGDAYALARQDADAVLTVQARDEARPYGPAKVDMELASVLAFGRQFADPAITPRALHLRRPRPAFAALYREVFGCPVHFGAPANALHLDPADLGRPMRSANPGAVPWLDGAAEAALQALGDDGLAARARRLAAQALPGGEPPLARIAAALGCSERTLQRRLADEGWTWRRLLDDTRRELATEALRDPRRPVTELAYLLGFVDANSFYRAFRRWTGRSPQAWRRGSAGGR
ncbi:AraC family transcriptional regulator [Piscinibacter sakaiensis]|uniref:AraC family transcriptional regulator n=1 Tax=Piscinibacter sakaiensis TaxID=1547922 RepID=UPI001E34A15B|nr:AraC family transcriptional regulator [Piscinibacter sakaiensis]